jgi:hypothetical protein
MFLNPQDECYTRITALSPHIAGWNDSTAWTRGSNQVAKRLTWPSSSVARRWTNFKVANMVEHIATKGLLDGQHIGPDKKTSKITLTSWVNSIQSYMEEHALDMVFCTVLPPCNYDLDILKWSDKAILSDCWMCYTPPRRGAYCLVSKNQSDLWKIQ